VSQTLKTADPIAPRFELEEATSPRLAPVPVPAAPGPLPRAPMGSASLAAGGALVLILGLAVLEAGNFVASQFDRAAALGWVTLAVAASGFGLIFAGLWRELRGLAVLRQVEHVRAALADPARARKAARAWLAHLPDGAGLLPAIDAAAAPEAIAALLRAGPLARMRGEADALGRNAAMQMFAASAVLPAPALDGVLVLWRGARLVRQVAEIYGLRPGTLGTLALLRRVLFGAAGVVATDLTANAMASALAAHPMLRHVAGDLPGAGVAARRMIVLARSVAVACSPLPD
jgi:putative membrane protein